MATPAIAFIQLANECEAEGLTPKSAERIAVELAKMFKVHATEVGILRVEKQNLVFVYPSKLQNVGSIPLNTSGSIAARTATTRRAEIINNVAQTKHTHFFEVVELKEKSDFGEKHDPSSQMIQKLISAPVVGASGAVGVIQISRKGPNAPASGPDFTALDLQKLAGAAAALAKCFK